MKRNGPVTDSAPSRETASNGLPKKLIKNEIFCAAVVLVLIIAFGFRDVVVGGRTLLTSNIAPGTLPSGAYGYTGYRVKTLPVLDPGASAWDYEPDAKVLHDDLSKRVLPLWNPYVACGAPFLANMFSAALSPQRLLVAISQSPFFWDIYLLSRLAVAGLLTFVFARRVGIGLPGSLVSAIIFMLSGHFVLEINMSDPDVQLWLPGLLLAIEELLRKPRYRTFVATTLLVSLIILGGMPESAFFIFLLSGMYFLVRLWILPEAHRDGVFAKWGRLITFAGGCMAGLLISLPLVLPFREYLSYAFNPRSPGVGTFHIDINTAASLIMPRFLGHLNASWAGVSSFSMLPYVGAASLLLALAAFSRSRPSSWQTIFFVSFALFYLLKAFGIAPVQWVSQLPLFNMTIFPKHAFPEFALCIGILAGIGAEGLLQNDADYFRLAMSSLVVVLIVTTFAAYYWKVAAQTDSLRTVVRSCVIVGFNIAFLWSLAWAARRFGPRRLVALGLIVFPAAELIAFIPPDRTKRYDSFTRPPFVDFLHKDQHIYRTFSIDSFLFPNTNAAYGISDIRSLDPLQVGRYMEFLRKDMSPKIHDRFDGSETSRDILRSPLLDLMNVKYVLASSEIPQRVSAGPLSREVGRRDRQLGSDGEKFTLVYEGEVKIYRNNTVLPRAFIVHQAEVISDKERIVTRLTEGDFDPRTTVLLEEPSSPPSISQVPHEEDGSPVIFERYESDYIRLKASSVNSGWLILTDTYYPGWEVRIDGQGGQILPADYIFRAVALNQGHHVIEFKYRPASFLLGAGISIVTLAVLLVAGVVLCLRSRFPARNATNGLAEVPNPSN
jgi:hypothetical protein